MSLLWVQALDNSLCRECHRPEEQHVSHEVMYHSTLPWNRENIQRNGLGVAHDNGEGYTEPGIYMSPQPGSDKYEDVWKVNTRGLRLHPDDNGNMHEFRDVGGSWFSKEDIPPERVNLHAPSRRLTTTYDPEWWKK